MPLHAGKPRFQLRYWPIAFRGCFVSYLFAYRNVPLIVESDLEDNERLKDLPPDRQDIPYMGPPVLHDLETGRTLSQMPAIVHYAAHHLDLMPEDPFGQALGMKVLLDCNDVLMEICRYNGSVMWERAEWVQFRSRRLPRWFRIFEESLARGMIGNEPITFADLSAYALWGNMIRCLPELEVDLHRQAPRTHALCRSIGAQPTLAAYVAEEEQKYGQTYCGGQIEASIRQMLKLDGEH